MKLMVTNRHYHHLSPLSMTKMEKKKLDLLFRFGVLLLSICEIDCLDLVLVSIYI